VVAEEVNLDVAEARVDRCFCGCDGHGPILSCRVNAGVAVKPVPRWVKSGKNPADE
jgi:hypothetical protein